MKDKKSLIGFLLIGLLFVAYMWYNGYKMEQQKEAAAEKQIEALANAASEAMAPTTTPSEPVAKEAEAVKADGLIVNATEVEKLVVDNDLMSIEFSTLGGQIVDVTLKEYTRYAPKEERTELVKLFDPQSARFDLSFYLRDEAAFRNVKVQSIEHNFTLLPVESFDDRKVVTLRLPFNGGAASMDYVYTIYNTHTPERDYLVDFDVRFVNLAPLMANQSSVGVSWSNRSYQNERSFKNENTYTTLAYRLPGENDIEDLGVSTSTEEEKISSSVDWVAFKQQYFTSALITRGEDFQYADLKYTTAPEKSGFIKNFSMSGGLAYTPQTEKYGFSFYLGPNLFPVLKNLTDENGESLELERVIPLGWIFSTFISRWVVIPVFNFLNNTLNIESFGLIILILTLLVKLLIFPLTYRSYLSTAKMRALRPEMEAINAKFPRQEDSMKKQQATMELYRKAGINPMSGCIPMLIQMPILIAMFRFFPASIELRGESFLWSDDLSSYDSVLDLPFNIPFYGDHISLFCLLMSVVMFAYSYLNYNMTSSSQPQMAGMKFMTVYMMPVMLLLWFNDYSSGLCYYYLLSNLITIVQTLAIRRFVNDDKIRARLTTKMANTKGKKSRFQQKYEEMMRQAEAAQNSRK